jgi:hypothetical protein
MCRMKILTLFLFLLSVLPLYAAEDKSEQLLEAVEKGNLTEVRGLVKAGADLNAREKEQGMTPLIMAVRDGNLVTAQSWRYHPEFYREFFDCLNGRAAAPPVRGGLHLFSRD